MSELNQFKCPQCKRIHVAFDEDMGELQCTDNEVSNLKLDTKLPKSDLLADNGWNFNHFSTKENVYRNATIEGVKPLKLKDLFGSSNNY